MEHNIPGKGLRRAVGKELTESQLFPLLSQGPQLLRKGALVPIGAAIVAGALLYGFRSDPDVFIKVLALLIGLVTVWGVYRLVGKPTPFPVLLASCGFSAALVWLLVSPMVRPTYNYLLHWAATKPEDIFPIRFLGNIVTAGLPEEALKAIPVLIGVWIWYKGSGILRERAGVREPLDGILLAACSAMGFALAETCLIYVNDAGNDAATKALLAASDNLAPFLSPNLTQEQIKQVVDLLQGITAGTGLFVALQTLLFRLVGEIAGHVAYSGVFGYYIGLAVMKPKHAARLVLTGYGIAVGLHALYDAIADSSYVLAGVVGILSYALLGSAILKARQISPTRNDNFAKAGDSVAISMAAPPPEPVSPAPAVRPSGPVLQVGRLFVPIREGEVVYAGQIVGLSPLAGNGIVAVVNRNPQDPNLLGLRNMSKSTWIWERPGKEPRDVAPERSLHLAQGSRIRFGQVDGEVC
jgi:RsiW-degrading membrane proteinase PrsW (M82 family)